MQPNILVITADQLGAHVLDRDEGWVATPHLDGLRRAGADFRRAYVTFPLCVPSRASMLTGRMPHEVGIGGNRAQPDTVVEPGARADSLGHAMAAAGYTCAYAGKWHATQASAPADAGFEVLAPFGDRGLVDACAEWLRGRADEEEPFLLVASFDDPHTICEYARRQPMPYGDVDAGGAREAPPLPANFAPAPFEPEAVRFEKAAAGQVYGTADYTADDWRVYRAAYRRLVERVDGYVGRLLHALDSAGLSDSTLVIFTSDHGDGDAAHGWNQKTALFEECVRVPLIVRGPGVSPGGRSGVVSVGLDLLPTVLTAAGCPRPGELRGAPLALGVGDGAAERVAVVETRFERSDPPLTRGRALVRGPYKYTVYSWGRHREQLHDLSNDPGEQRNLAVESAFDDVRDEMRTSLLRWCRDTDDRDFLKFVPLPTGTPAAVHEEIFAVPY
ncbi:sulfatase-like hydrolase/transferase [Microbacterium esteraromaticum]|uniref:Sulfatase-like hydrolase/transferase n=1 Tax=Microbacterium esteraromaticum TaxID=57043 RepID=A0A939DUR1_9MICO|nr:sulfatase-like hydrolase/transferase [Microbacterium esteraromaticum]MBN8414562.1 sulfatase-like hydrolase/transferase [Microbacterium esteraromaticum]